MGRFFCPLSLVLVSNLPEGWSLLKGVQPPHWPNKCLQINHTKRVLGLDICSPRSPGLSDPITGEKVTCPPGWCVCRTGPDYMDIRGCVKEIMPRMA